MTKILHIYPSSDSMIAHYVDMLAQGMPGDVETRTTDKAKEMRMMCLADKPDIVHLHGCRQADMLKAASQARRMGCRIVVTTHGHLEPWEQPAAAPTTLRTCIAHAYALIAQSPIEARELGKLGWNDRIEVIGNPIITRTSTESQLARKTLAVYRKVLASDVLELMDGDTRKALGLLLKAGITCDKRWLADMPTASPDWQRLYVYAEQEGVLTTLRLGINVLGLDAPTPQPAPIYLPNGYKKPTEATTQDIVPLIRLIKDEAASRRLSLLRLTELDLALRDPHVDEEVLLLELKAARLLPFFGSLLQILAEQTGLDEGFMPCPPIDNKLTNNLRTVIIKHLKI